MKVSKFAKVGCLSFVGLFILLAVIGTIGRALMTPEQKAAEAAQQQAAAAKEKADEQAATAKRLTTDEQAADGLLRKMTLLRRHLPPIEQVREIPPPASPRLDDVVGEPVDYGFFSQFAETGFTPLPATQTVPWYRGRIMDDIEDALTSEETPEKRKAKLAQAATDLESKPYYVIFLPLEQELPKVDPDQKTYASGYFNGWEIVVDAKKGEPICQVKFEASSSAHVSKTRLKVEGIPLGSGITSAIGKDFTDNFWAAANKALAPPGAAAAASP
jgi:hypothetical protein